MSEWFGTTGFLSHRGTAYGHVAPITRWMQETGRVGRLLHYAPNALALDHELLLPFELVELAMGIWEELERCDVFVVLSSGDYWGSLWTHLEAAGWRFLHREPSAVLVGVDARGEYAAAVVPADPMPAPEKVVWQRLRTNMKPFVARDKPLHAAPAYRGGKLARKYYVMRCSVCGEYTLLPKKGVEADLKNGRTVVCRTPWCRTVHTLSRSAQRNAVRYRHPLVAVPTSGSPRPAVRPIAVDDLLELIFGSTLPEYIRTAD